MKLALLNEQFHTRLVPSSIPGEWEFLKSGDYVDFGIEDWGSPQESAAVLKAWYAGQPVRVNDDYLLVPQSNGAYFTADRETPAPRFPSHWPSTVTVADDIGHTWIGARARRDRYTQADLAQMHQVDGGLTR